ncbi:hypothetical protein NEOLEDRAFT_1026779, partial [Neolentinus lepideus HHB14362 ss-1]
SAHKATQKAAKLPKDYEYLCAKTLAWVTVVCQIHHIHPDLWVNADQTGNKLFPTGQYTYEKKGSKDVSVSDHEEKQQTTAVTTLSQSSWMPACNAAHQEEADALGFTYAHGDKWHWSSQETMKQWVMEIFDPYIECMKVHNSLPADAKSLLLIDVLPVHIAKKNPDDFLPWMKQMHLNVIVLFIPGGC